MAGSKRELAPGRWELRIYAGTVNGKRRQISRVHRGDAKSADVELARMTVRLAEGEYAPSEPAQDPDDPTVREWLEGWYTREHGDWSPTSAATARGHLDRHILPELGDLQLVELRLRDVQRWLARLRDKGLAAATVHRVFGVLRSGLEQAERWEIIARNPAAHADLPRIRYSESHIPTAAELVGALEVAPSIHARTLIWLAAATGGRRGQLVALRWSDFDLDEGLVTFHRAVVKVAGGTVLKEPKGGRPIRAALDPTTVEVVKRYRLHRQEQAMSAGVGRVKPGSFVFARDVSGRECWYPDTATKLWERVRDMRGPGPDGEPGAGPLLLRGLQGVRLHDLRHAHATLLIAAGVDRKTVAGRLGHAQVSTTDRYTHPVTEADRRAAVIIGELLTGAS